MHGENIIKCPAAAVKLTLLLAEIMVQQERDNIWVRMYTPVTTPKHDHPGLSPNRQTTSGSECTHPLPHPSTITPASLRIDRQEVGQSVHTRYHTQARAPRPLSQQQTTHRIFLIVLRAFMSIHLIASFPPPPPRPSRPLPPSPHPRRRAYTDR